jgi:hypothetical protein
LIPSLLARSLVRLLVRFLLRDPLELFVVFGMLPFHSINLTSVFACGQVLTNQKISDSRQDTIAAASRGPPGTTATGRRALFFFF